MGKRAATSATAPAAKKEKVNPVFVEIQDAVKKADHLSVNCRAMLAAMVPTSFGNPNGERSEQQVTVIQWLEDALMKEQAKLVADSDAVAAKLAEIEAKKAAEVAVVQKAETALTEKKDVIPLKKNALAEATIAMTTTKKLLAEKQEEHRTCDAPYLAAKKEQVGLASAFVEHFKVPLEAGECLHYEQLQPFLSNLELEESFMVSVPSSCMKTQAERGSFDHVVLQALEQALLDRANQIKDVVSNRSPESEAREMAVQKAEEQLAIDSAAQKKATAELAAAQKEVELGAATLKEMEEVVANVEVELKAALKQNDKVRFVQEGFEQGPLASFRTCKDGAMAAEKCATAGA